MALLSTAAANERMKEIPEWKKRARTLRRQFQFKSFLQAMDFVNKVARKAESNDHHPDIDIRWNKVALIFSTHSEGGLTAKDFDSARQCSQIYCQQASRK